ncbi:DUF6631 family protein [Pinirhizobacter sp.]|uniref:DUF6631 family protein n=1 Tax=Pinirhizobacter sp. TaxID=2950432 RepID=UPI002F3F2A0F
MARKVTPPATKQKAKPAPAVAPPDDGANDAAILHPDLTFTLGGRELTVREYSFVAGLRVRAKAKYLVQDLHQQIVTGEALTEDVINVLAVHSDLVRELVIEATVGADGDWYDSLDEPTGTQLLLTWWSVCGPFFIRQIASRIGQAMKLKEQLVGLTSSMSSRAPATDRPTS